MKAATAVALVLGTLVALETAAQEEQPVAKVIGILKEHMTQECSMARKRLSLSTQSPEKEFASVLVRMSCDCMPGEIDRVAADLSAGRENATTTQGAFLARMKTAVNVCTARLARTDIRSRCLDESEALPGITDRKGYCGCLSARLDALDDDAIATAASASHRNSQESAQARLKDQPQPARVPTLLDGIEAACRKATDK